MVAGHRRCRELPRPEPGGWRARGGPGIGIVDSQCLSGDTYVALAMAAAATSTLRLATAVTNTATRHPAAAASAAASVQAESGGRFVLGIGRGDSALAHLGLAPAPVAQFEHYLQRLQGYLRRDEVPFDLATDTLGGLRSSDIARDARRSDASAGCAGCATSSRRCPSTSPRPGRG